MKVEVIRNATGKILDVRSKDDLKRHPWAAGDKVSFSHSEEGWDEVDYRNHRGTPELDAMEAQLLKDASVTDIKQEIERRGLDADEVLRTLLLGREI